MNVVGIDLSLTSTGLAWDNTTVAISSKLKGVKRLADLRKTILEAVTSLDDPWVVLEGYSYGSRNSQSHSIGELGGVIKLGLHEAGVPVALAAPTCRSKFATGKGNASKSEVASAVSARTGIVWHGKGSEDQIDAWVLQEMGMTQQGLGRFTWPNVNLTALTGVDWTEWTERG
jgi:crossover junction endodeoxyribonuclease RuvC